MSELHEPGIAPDLSIVIPVYRGARTVGRLVDRLIELLAARRSLEIVLVNDASPDDSEDVCLDRVAAHPEIVVYVDLSRNFGEHNAVMAGLRIARGAFVVTMDDDLQNPPEEVERLVEEAERGPDAVYAQFETKQHPWARNLGSRFNDAVATRLLKKPPGLYLSTFRCLRRMVVDEVIRYDGPYPYVDGLVLRSTSHLGTVRVRHDPRSHGRSGYTFAKLLALWLAMSTSFSILPLRAVIASGLAMSLIGLCFAVEVFCEKLYWPAHAVGWASLMTALILFSGIQLVVVGTVGEYLGRLLMTVNRTPQSVVRRVVRGRDAVAAAAPRSSVKAS